METQQSISDWALSVFGLSKTSLILAARAHKEASELYEVLAHTHAEGGGFAQGDFEKFKSELADVAIVLYQVAAYEGVDLEKEMTVVGSSYGIGTLEELGRKILSEFLHLFYWLETRNAQKDYIAKGLVDIFYLLRVMAKRFGLVLNELVTEKMVVNRQRRWKITGSGVGQHE